VFAVFVVIWLGGAVVYYFEATHAVTREGADSEPYRHSVSACLYRSLQLFHFHDSHWPDSSQYGGDVVRFLAGATGFGLLLSVFGWFFRGGLAAVWHRRPWHRNFLVVVGDSTDAKHLGDDVAARRQDVVRVAHAAGRLGTPETGIAMFDETLNDPYFWRSTVRVGRAREVVVIGGGDADNIGLSLIIEEAVRRRQNGMPLRCHVHLMNLHLKKGLVSLLPANESHLLTRHYFNRYEMMARLLARKHPLPAALVEEKALPEHYIIIGFEQFGQNIALKLVKMGQQVVRRQTAAGDLFDVCKPRVTIIDRRGKKATEIFLRSHPGFVDTCDLQVVEADCTDREFLELEFLSAEEAPARCSLIFALEDEALVVSTILMMLDVCQDAAKDIDGIYFRTARHDGVGHLLQKRQPELAKEIPIVTFGSDAEIFTEDVVLNHSLDLMAACVHEAYLTVARPDTDPHNPAPAANKKWMSLTEEERDGNREAADHMWAKVRTLGYELEEAPLSEEVSPAASPDDETLVRAIETHMEALASSEHYRWMAWRLINGWTYGADRDPLRKLHPNIVSYEELTEADREKDRVIVRIIPELVRIGRLRVKQGRSNVTAARTIEASPEDARLNLS